MHRCRRCEQSASHTDITRTPWATPAGPRSCRRLRTRCPRARRRFDDRMRRPRHGRQRSRRSPHTPGVVGERPRRLTAHRLRPEFVDRLRREHVAVVAAGPVISADDVAHHDSGHAEDDDGSEDGEDHLPGPASRPRLRRQVDERGSTGLAGTERAGRTRPRQRPGGRPGGGRGREAGTTTVAARIQGGGGRGRRTTTVAEPRFGRELTGALCARDPGIGNRGSSPGIGPDGAPAAPARRCHGGASKRRRRSPVLVTSVPGSSFSGRRTRPRRRTGSGPRSRSEPRSHLQRGGETSRSTSRGR